MFTLACSVNIAIESLTDGIHFSAKEKKKERKKDDRPALLIGVSESLFFLSFFFLSFAEK